jgi:hypothetical protein
VGSVLAGVKAGAVASLYFAASVSLFNIVLLYSFKGQVLAFLTQNYPTTCPASATPGITGTAESCFAVIVGTGVPEADLLRLAVIAMLFAVGIGVYFDYLPGRTYFRRAFLVVPIIVIGLLFLGLYGLVTDTTQLVLMVVFESGTACIYAVILAWLYRRFTREVEFQGSANSKILVDSRDVTGKKRTYAVNSTHKLVAGDEKTFKGWLVSGGLSVSEPREAKTSLQVAGDGLLKLR